MFEKFTSANHRDFQQRYHGTFGFFTRNNRKLLVMIQEINQHHVEFVDEEGLTYKLKADSEDEGTGFTFIVPKSYYHNTSDGIPLLVRRIPARQYSRGICSKNTAIESINGTAYPVTFEILKKLYCEKVEVGAALVAAKSTKMPAAGIAISPQFAVGINTKVLKCFNMRIGTVDWSDVFTITLDDSDMWRQEVVDALKRSNLVGNVK